MWRDHIDGRFYAGGSVQPDLAAFNVASGRTFTRSTTKTRLGPTGLLESVAINAEALDFAYGGSPLGLSLEMPRTNYWPDSEFSGGTSGLSAVANVTPVSDMEGGRTGLALNNSVSHAFIRRVIAGTSGMCTISAFIETEDGAPPVFGSSGATGAANTCTLMLRGVILDPTTYRVERYGARTWRVSGSSDTAGDNTYFGAYQYQTNQQRRIRVTGLQFEAGAFVSSYIPTGGTSLTRGSDLDRSIGATEPFPGYVQGQGAMIWEGDLVSDQNHLLCRLDNTASGGLDGISMGIIAGNVAYLIVAMGGVTQAGIYSAAGAIAPGTRFRMVAAWQTDRFEFWLNGAKVGATDTSGVVPTVQRLGLGRDAGNLGVGSFCHLARFGYLAAPPWDRLAALSQIGGV